MSTVPRYTTAALEFSRVGNNAWLPLYCMAIRAREFNSHLSAYVITHQPCPSPIDTVEPMISRDEVLANAIEALGNSEITRAQAWIALAAELRAEPEPAGARLTLHDIEAKLCAHNNQIAIRDRRATTSWWLHARGHSICDPG